MRGPLCAAASAALATAFVAAGAHAQTAPARTAQVMAPYKAVAFTGTAYVDKPFEGPTAPEPAFDLDSAPSPAAMPSAAAARPNDPFERVNRGLFRFNKGLDRAVVGPLARGYKAVAPSPVRKGVRNVLNNLGQPVVFANNVLQGDAVRAGETATRFVTNSTVGVLGVFDVATAAGVPSHGEDFGQTLAKYGAPSGPYLFVPVLGPTTVRDAAGRVVDSAAHPLSWADYGGKANIRTTVGVTRGLDARARLDPSLRQLEKTATDEYATMRSLYFQNRRNEIANGATDPLADLPDFGAPDPAPRPAPPPRPPRRRR